MRKTEVLTFFKLKLGRTADNDEGVTATAESLGLTKGAVSQWDDIIPELSARKIHDITRGQLKFDPKLYKRERRA